jgi:hypothetical protein
MKKIIPLVLLATAAVFLLAGCDILLESIYPDQTMKNKGIYSLPVEVRANPSAINEWWNHKVWVQLTDSQGNTQYQDSLFQGDSYSYTVFASTTFNFLNEGSYSVFVWFDANDNGQPDSDEPSGSSYVPDLNSTTTDITDVITIQ